jgi:hypothetical protein
MTTDATEYTGVGRLFSLAPNVRELAMGQAGAASVGRAVGLPSNPASLAWRGGLSVSSLLDGQAGIGTYGVVAAGWDQVALGIQYLDFGEIDVTDASGLPVGRSLRYYTTAMTAAVGIRAEQLPFLPDLRFGGDIALGLTGKALRAQLAEEAPGIGAAVDLSMLMQFHLGRLAEPLTLGLVLENALALPVQYGDSHKEDWPRRLTAGSTVTMPAGIVLAAGTDTEGAVRLGAEWSPVSEISVRVGTRSEGVWIWSLGVGVTFATWVVDVALVLHPYLPAHYAASLALQW